MPALVRDGASLAYEQSGTGAGPTYVFVHGWCCDRSFFAPQIAHFGRSHPVLAVELRGHGQSGEVDGGLSIEGFASDVGWLCDQLGLDRIVAIGHSMGGVTVLQLAADRPDLVEAVVMVDPAYLRWPEKVRPFLTDLAATIRRGGAEQVEARQRMVRGMFHADDDETRREQIVAAMVSAPIATAAAGLEALRDYDGHDAAARVKAPLLCIGADSPPMRKADLQARCPHAVYEQTVGVGHFNQLEAPGVVNEMIERFLS